jgi:hypothetical protein
MALRGSVALRTYCACLLYFNYRFMIWILLRIYPIVVRWYLDAYTIYRV